MCVLEAIVPVHAEIEFPSVFQVKQEQRTASLGYVKSFETAIDIGAHIGFWARELREKFKKLIAFEPQAIFREAFVHNVNMSNVTLYPYALSNESSSFTMNNMVVTDNQKGSVEARTLDSFNIQDKIDYINVHGTSTPLGDIAETNAILDLFKEHSYILNISSTKSMTGHLLGAAGVVESIACIMSVKNNIIPPTINHFERDEKIDPKLNLTFNESQEKNVDFAISNTFGFGGHNASTLFKKFTE